MNRYTCLIAMIFALLLAGCGGSDDGGDAPAAPVESAAPSAGGGTETMSAGPVEKAAEAMEDAADAATMYVDHAEDEVEFQLRRSIDGWKSLLEDINDSEEVEKIKAHIAELESELNKL